MLIYIIIFSILSYLTGSFSSALWYGKWFFKVDVRNSGSKNAGATNSLRVLGYKAAIPVFLTDILKSYLSVQLIHFVPDIVKGSELSYQIMLLFGICAVVGHIFPIYSNFKGGKGVASMLGLILAISPLATAFTFGVFLVVFLFSKIVSISSICAAIAFPIIIYLINKNQSITLIIFAIFACILILITHNKNIKRLIKGEEKRLEL